MFERKFYWNYFQTPRTVFTPWTGDIKNKNLPIGSEFEPCDFSSNCSIFTQRPRRVRHGLHARLRHKLIIRALKRSGKSNRTTKAKNRRRLVVARGKTRRRCSSSPQTITVHTRIFIYITLCMPVRKNSEQYTYFVLWSPHDQSVALNPDGHEVNPLGVRDTPRARM